MINKISKAIPTRDAETVIIRLKLDELIEAVNRLTESPEPPKSEAQKLADEINRRLRGTNLKIWVWSDVERCDTGFGLTIKEARALLGLEEK